jgi:hypothetical protein
MMLLRNFLLRSKKIHIPVYWKAATPSRAGSSYNSSLPKQAAPVQIALPL